MNADEPGFPYELPPPKDTMTVYNEVSLDWKVQIYNWVVRQYGGKPSSYLQGTTKDTLLPEMAVEEFAKVVIAENDNDPRLAADVLKAALTEHITLMSAMAMQHSMKEKGLMPALTKVVDNMIEQVNTKGEENEALRKAMDTTLTVADTIGNVKAKLDEISQVTIDSTEPKEATPTEDQFLDPKRVKFDSKGNVIKKRKKSKAKSNHLPNMKSRQVKSALGAAILGMLGKVQRDTQDTQKRALLKALPAADVIELVTGEKLPDYQANLINKFQADADPEAPIVARIKEEQGKTGSTTHRLVLDADDPDPASTISHVLQEHGMVVPVEIVKGDLSVTTHGSHVKDLRILFGEESNFFHYERFTEEAADELKSSIEYVQEHTADPKFYEGLVSAIVESIEPKLADWFADFSVDETWSLVNKLIVGYTVGYTQGIADSTHKLASQAVDAAPADLG